MSSQGRAKLLPVAVVQLLRLEQHDRHSAVPPKHRNNLDHHENVQDICDTSQREADMDLEITSSICSHELVCMCLVQHNTLELGLEPLDCIILGDPVRGAHLHKEYMKHP